MLFDGIIGNDLAKSRLQNALDKGVLPKTLLFQGQDGIGKSLFALAIARHLLDPDSSCQAKWDKLSHPDLHLYFPEGKTQMHAIAQIREFIEEVHKPPFEAKAKIFIIHDADRMLPASANALLKTLEEPDPDSVIILLTSRAEDLLPTILSRCAKISFQPIEEEKIKAYLEKEKQPALKAGEIAKLSEGSLGRALEIAQQTDFEERRNLLLDILMRRGIASYADFWQALQKLENLYEDKTEESSYKEVDLLFAQILLWQRDLHLALLPGEGAPLHFPEALTYKSSKRIPPFEKVQGWVFEARTAVQRNMKLSACLEYLFLRLQII
jgi:DNA polymerase-3 subunit delta'